MNTHLHFPAARTAIAFGLPFNEAIERLNLSARELTASAEKAPSCQGFGQRVALAVKRKVARPRTAIFASATRPSTAVSASSDEGFAKRLKEAVEKKSGAKRHQQYADRERERYAEQRRRATSE